MRRAAGAAHSCKSLLPPCLAKQIVTKNGAPLLAPGGPSLYDERHSPNCAFSRGAVVRHGVKAGLMKVLLATMVTVVAGSLLVSPLAEAGGWGMGFAPALQAQGPMKHGDAQRGRGRDPRGGRETRPPNRDDRRQGRMTDEERRDLHRDLDRANREIYRPRPSR
jgi:hypothetical protein